MGLGLTHFNRWCHLRVTMVVQCAALLLLFVFVVDGVPVHPDRSDTSAAKLRFNANGKFKIVQVADMHYANGASTKCLDVLDSQVSTCSDVNTTVFLQRMLTEEKPDLVVFTGDNIMGGDCKIPLSSLKAAFDPVIKGGIPWAAVLGNHDQEGGLNRQTIMLHLSVMCNSLAQLNPASATIIDGYGNYNLEVFGPSGSILEQRNLLNLYFVDSGDYSKVSGINGYDWIKASQSLWVEQTSAQLKKASESELVLSSTPPPALAYFHIPVPEFSVDDDSKAITGVKQESTESATVNSGFLTALISAGDVKAAFTGHDHLNDYCVQQFGIQLCYSGGFGYHGYGKAGWARRSRVVEVSLNGTTATSIQTWKRLNDEMFSKIDDQILWRNSGFQNSGFHLQHSSSSATHFIQNVS